MTKTEKLIYLFHMVFSERIIIIRHFDEKSK